MHSKPNSGNYVTRVTKALSLILKYLWYIQRFLFYSINARSLSHEAFTFDDIYLLYALVNNERVEVSRMLQWKLWIISDNITRSISIGGIITKIASFFWGFFITLHFIPPSFINTTFIKKFKQFKLVDGI